MDMLDVTDAAESSHLLPKVICAQEALLQAAKMFWLVHTIKFRNLHERYKHQGGKDLGEGVDMFL